MDFFFLQETHSSLADEKKWADEFFFHMLKQTLVEQQLDIQEIRKSTSWTKKTDTNGRILILDFKMVDETNFVLVNIYNPNTETEQVTTLHDLGKLLKTI